MPFHSFHDNIITQFPAIILYKMMPSLNKLFQSHQPHHYNLIQKIKEILASIQIIQINKYLDIKNNTMENTGAQILELENKIAELEAKNLQQFQKQMLASLYSIREALISDIKNFSGVGTVASSEQVDAKDKKIAELEAENRRLNYRINHLCRNLRKALPE